MSKFLLLYFIIIWISSCVANDDCGRGWTKYDRSKSCFLVLPSRMQWSEAEKTCIRHGGKLASIIDEYENTFVFDLAKRANLSIPTLWLGRLTLLSRSGAYEWHDGSIGRHTEGFREPPTGTDLCLTMWLDFDRADGSWTQWDCAYPAGYAGVCKKALKKAAINVNTPHPPVATTYLSKRCCIQTGCSHRCLSVERCIPDDLDCWYKTCADHGIGWCLPMPPRR